MTAGLVDDCDAGLFCNVQNEFFLETEALFAHFRFVGVGALVFIMIYAIFHDV